MGRKAIAADPTNPVPLVQVASVLAETTRDTDLDREQRLDEAAKDAQAAIDNINTGLIVPPNAPPEKVAAAKASILTMAYDTLGMVNLNKKDYAAAEQALLKAADTSKANPEAVVYLRLSVAQDQLKEYPEGAGFGQQGRAITRRRAAQRKTWPSSNKPACKSWWRRIDVQPGNAAGGNAGSGQASDASRKYDSRLHRIDVPKPVSWPTFADGRRAV